MAIDRGPFNALVDDDGSNTVGTLFGKQDIKDVLLDPIDAFVGNGGTWASYTPTWAGGGGGTAPALGDGALVGRYMLIGKLCHIAIGLKLGSTSVVGSSGYWRLTLPQLMAAPTGVQQEATFHCGVMSGGGSIYGPFAAYADSNASVYACNHTGALWGPTVPFAWGAGGLFSLRGTYEVT